MAKAVITEEVKKEVIKIIDDFNNEYFDEDVKVLFYLAEFKGKFLYLKRHEYGTTSPVVRLEYTGDMKDWDFAIFKWSSEEYDFDEGFFPGAQFVDGTIEGAMKAGLEAYPV